MKPRLYLETTIPSYLVARESRDAILRGQQVATRKWWDERRSDYELFASEFVDLEAGRGDAKMSVPARRRCKVCPGWRRRKTSASLPPRFSARA